MHLKLGGPNHLPLHKFLTGDKKNILHENQAKPVILK